VAVDTIGCSIFRAAERQQNRRRLVIDTMNVCPYHALLTGEGGIVGGSGPRIGTSDGFCPGSSCGCDGASGSCIGTGMSGPGCGLPGGSSRGGSLGRPGLVGGTSCGSLFTVIAQAPLCESWTNGAMSRMFLLGFARVGICKSSRIDRCVRTHRIRIIARRDRWLWLTGVF
jgi:hypothetical protein